MTSSPSQSTTLSDHQVISSGLDFAGVTRFLQQDAVNPETQSLRLSVSSLSALVERTAHVRRTQSSIDTIERQAARLSHQIRQHQLLLTGMGSAWHGLYEFGAYQQAVQSLRQALEGWRETLRRRSSAEPQCFQDFERLAWRTLGEALLVLDLYEQQSTAPQRAAPPSTPPRPSRPTLLARLRAWLGGQRL